MYAARRSKLIEQFTGKDNLLICLFKPKHIFYYTGFYSDPHERFMGLIWTSTGGWRLLLPALDEAAAKQKLDQDIEVQGYFDHENPYQKLKQFVPEIGHVSLIALEKDYVPYQKALQLLALCAPQVEALSLTEYIQKQTLRKDQLEQEALIKAGEVTDLILAATLKQFQRGMTEIDLAAELEYQAKKHGAEQMSFQPSILAKEKSALPHGKPNQTKIGEGLLLIDFGIVLNGYCSDMTRTFHVGEWEPEARKIYDIVLEAQLKALEQAGNVTLFEELDSVARDVIAGHGYGEFFIHRLGHGLGMEVHEFPSVGQGVKEKIKAGMTFSIEPGIYIPGVGGVRIEDCVIRQENSVTVLNHYPKQADLAVIGV